MLVKQQLSENIVRYTSDSGKYIYRVEDGELFEERLDVVGGKWTYAESDIDAPSTKKEEE